MQKDSLRTLSKVVGIKMVLALLNLFLLGHLKTRCDQNRFKLKRIAQQRVSASGHTLPANSRHYSRYLIGLGLGLSKIFTLMIMTGYLTGCGNLYLDAPPDSHIRLLAKKTPAQVQVEQVVWFKYWGNEPFSESEPHAATIIQQNNLKEARIRMVNTAADTVISMFTGLFGFPRRTLIVEGNPYPTEKNVPPTSKILSDQTLSGIGREMTQ